jgi:hypothetical protein
MVGHVLGVQVLAVTVSYCILHLLVASLEHGPAGKDSTAAKALRSFAMLLPSYSFSIESRWIFKRNNTYYASLINTHPPPWMYICIPLLFPLAGLNTRVGISLPGSREGSVPFTPSGSTTGFGNGVFPSHLIFRYSAAPTCAGS